jgi:hypothetical protein
VRHVWEPVGPLPASVYWRRRAVAVAAVTVVLLLVAWCVANAVSPAPRPVPASLAANSVAMSSAPQDDPPSPTPSGTADPTTPSDDAPTSAPATEGTPDATSAAPSESLRPDATPDRPVPVATPVPVPPTGPVPCTNEMLTITAEVGQPSYRVGQRPVFRLVVTNSSGQPCVRDLDNTRQEVVVWNADRSARLWSSNDCYDLGRPDLRTLVPGQPVVSSVTWAGRTSAPKCAAPRTTVPAGSYQVMARLDDDISAPTPLTLTP